METMKNELTLPVAETLIGKKIKWHAPADSANEDYTGIDIIKTVDSSNQRRPLATESIEGDDLGFAFVEYEDGQDLCYSDGGRYISYEVME